MSKKVINPKKDRLFVHDIINQTHGLMLFFKERQHSLLGIKLEEIEMLNRQVEILQSLIKDHFDQGHKNLSNHYDWVSIQTIERAVKNLLEIYLNESHIKLFFKSNLEDNILNLEQVMIYFPTFYRIMNNLIKNMAEVKAEEVYIDLKYLNNEIKIETKNKSAPGVFNQKGMGLGLESVHQLAKESGGEFIFYKKDGYWVNQLNLPYNNKDNNNKLSLEKKAA